MTSSAMFVALCTDGKLPHLKQALRKGANVNSQDEYERTGLMMAMRYSQPYVAAFLLQSEAIEVNAIDALGRCALHYAALRGNYTGLAMLLDRPDLTTINHGDVDGLTPLAGAVFSNASKCIKIRRLSQNKVASQQVLYFEPFI